MVTLQKLLIRDTAEAATATTPKVQQQLAERQPHGSSRSCATAVYFRLTPPLRYPEEKNHVAGGYQ